MSNLTLSMPFDEHGRVKLNAIWESAGKPDNKQPSQWLRNKSTKEYIEFLRQNANLHFDPINVVQGGSDPSIWAVEDLAIEYAAWINVEVKHRVIQGFKAYHRGESKQLSPAEMFAAQAQLNLDIERRQLAIEQEQESIKDRLKAVEGKTDTVSKPKPAGYGSKDDLVLELKREFDVSGAVIEFVIKRYCGQYSDTYEYSYQKNEATFKDEAKCWQTDMVRAELETFLSETYPHKRKNCFTHDDYDGYFQWPSNKSNWKKSN